MDEFLSVRLGPAVDFPIRWFLLAIFLNRPSQAVAVNCSSFSDMTDTDAPRVVLAMSTKC